MAKKKLQPETDFAPGGIGPEAHRVAEGEDVKVLAPEAVPADTVGLEGLEDLDAELPAEEPAGDAPTAPEEPAAEPIAREITVSFALPVSQAPVTGYCSRHIDIRLSGPQAEALRRLQDGLDGTGKRLANGKRVVNNADAIRYVLEQLTAG